MKLEQIAIYRITHIENIPHVLQYGITHKNSSNNTKGYVSIGDMSLIDVRTSKEVWVDNGDFQNLQAQTITLGDFIPFYFGAKMPMLYVIQHGGNFVEKATSPHSIVYLKCFLVKVIENCPLYFFSDGHATDGYTTFYDKSKLNSLPSIIDWEAVREQYWGGHENLNLKRKKQAEFLVSTDVPAKCISAFGCYDEAAKQKLLTFGIEASKIKLIPHAYY